MRRNCSRRLSATSNYVKEFEALGPHDSKGRTLRKLDLDKRLFEYPMSFVIYTEAWDKLPRPMLDLLYRRLYEVLTGDDMGETWSHLSRRKRQAILDILRETKEGLPDYWHESGE